MPSKLVNWKINLIHYSKTNPRSGAVLNALWGLTLLFIFLMGMLLLPLSILVPFTMALNYILPGHWLFITLLDTLVFFIAAILISDMFIAFENEFEEEVRRHL